jgi:hypothetical protein
VHGARAYYYDHKEEIAADADWARSTSRRRWSTSAVGPPGRFPIYTDADIHVALGWEILRAVDVLKSAGRSRRDRPPP